MEGVCERVWRVWESLERVCDSVWRECVSTSERESPELDREAAKVEREFYIDNLLVRSHIFIVMIRWTGLAPWVFEFPFPGSPTSAPYAVTDFSQVDKPGVWHKFVNFGAGKSPISPRQCV